jgi:hypothetical protein
MKEKTTSAQNSPTLLSGGNPQISKGDGDDVVQQYINAMPSWKRDHGRWIDDIITATVPQVRKAVRWNTPFYGIADQGWFLGFHCFNRYVKVTFLNGASLEPLPPIESKDAKVRYWHLHENETPDRETFVHWLQQAAKLPGDPLF